MTNAERNAALSSKMRRYTTANTTTQRAAQDALVREGFYLKNGKAAPQFVEDKEALSA